MKQRLVISALAAALALGAGAQNVQKLTANKTNEYGLIYALPLTGIDLTIEAEKTVKQPGEFFRYAKKYLGIEPIKEPSTVYTVKSAVITSHGIADQEERYLVQFKSGQTPFIVIDDHDFPMAVNTEARPVDSPELPEAREAEPTVLETAAARQAMTEEMLKSPSSAKRAELAAARIFEIRQTRSDIISGNADQMPGDGQAMKLALDNLAAQEAALTAMFAGTTQTSTQVRTYTVMPPEQNKKMVVARLSVTDGRVNADNLTGDPIYLDISVKQRGELPKNDKGEPKKFPKGGLAYRVPGTAGVTAEFDGRQLDSRDLDVAQYGVVFGLEPGMFTDKKAPAYAVFNPASGALVELGTNE